MPPLPTLMAHPAPAWVWFSDHGKTCARNGKSFRGLKPVDPRRMVAVITFMRGRSSASIPSFAEWASRPRQSEGLSLATVLRAGRVHTRAGPWMGPEPGKGRHDAADQSRVQNCREAEWLMTSRLLRAAQTTRWIAVRICRVLTAKSAISGPFQSLITGSSSLSTFLK